MTVDGRPYPLLPIPFGAAGAVAAEIQFSNGATLAISATSVALRLMGEPVLLDRFDA